VFAGRWRGTGGVIDVEPSSHTGMIGVAWTPWAIGPGHPAAAPQGGAGWNGFYVGGYVGGRGIVNEIDIPLLADANFNGVGGEGWLGGGMIGANWQPGSAWVLGIQGDIGTTGLETELEIPGVVALDAHPDLTASASLRAYPPSP